MYVNVELAFVHLSLPKTVKLRDRSNGPNVRCRMDYRIDSFSGLADYSKLLNLS